MQCDPFVNFSTLEAVIVLVRKADDAVILDWAKSGALVFVAAILQVSVFSDVTILNGTPDLLLVTIICIALLRGPVVGAAAGFWGGLLIDTANLGTLGVTSLLLTVAGYWIGRYGETTGQRPHARAVRLRRRDHAPVRDRLARASTTCSATPRPRAPSSGARSSRRSR